MINVLKQGIIQNCFQMLVNIDTKYMKEDQQEKYHNILLITL